MEYDVNRRKYEVPPRGVINEALRKAKEVLESGTFNAVALNSTINAHHEAVNDRKELEYRAQQLEVMVTELEEKKKKANAEARRNGLL